MNDWMDENCAVGWLLNECYVVHSLDSVFGTGMSWYGKVSWRKVCIFWEILG